MRSFSRETSRVFLYAIAEAQRLEHQLIEPTHLLIGLARLGGPVAEVLVGIGLPAARLRTLTARLHKKGTGAGVVYSQELRRLVTLARERAGSQLLNPRHLLLALIDQGGPACAWLGDTGELARLQMLLEDEVSLEANVPPPEGFE